MRVRVDEVVQQCPLQQGPVPGVDPEPGPAQTRPTPVVDQLQPLGQRHVVGRRKIEPRRLPGRAQDLVVLLPAGHHVVVGQVRQGVQERAARLAVPPTRPRLR